MRSLAPALILLLPLGSAAATTVTQRHEVQPDPEEVRHWGNLRIGGAMGAGQGRPEICGEFLPLTFLAVEACGSGAGILHDEPIHQAMHVRAKVSPWRWALGEFLLEPLFGFGMIELQVGEDQPGFRFGDTGPDNLETAGFEVMGGLRTLLPVGGDFELVADLSVGVGYTPHAPQLIHPHPRTPAFGSFTVGFGF